MIEELKSIVAGFLSAEHGDAVRIFHGRGHRYPGLEHVCVDWYSPSVLITLFDEFDQLDELHRCIEESDRHQQVKSIVVQKRFERGAPALALKGVINEQLIVSEGKLRFEVHFGQHQNIGLFLDTRLLRDWLLNNSEDKNILNLFAYTCSLSVAALAGGASGVTNVDMSRPSIQWGEKNHRLNEQDMKKVKSIPHNVYKSWGRIHQFGRYDLVIIDPPTRQKGSFDVSKNYPSLIKRMTKLCNPGAEIIATVNSPFLDESFLPELFERHLPQSKLLGNMDVAPEFLDEFPERGLKIYRFLYEPDRAPL